jgi:predicted methyltransferase
MNTKTNRGTVTALLAAVLLAGCNGIALNPEKSAAMAREAAGAASMPGPEVTTPPPPRRRPVADDGEIVVAAALDNPNRLPGDRTIDARRHPDEVLRFFDIRPGMAVLDLYSGGGYYSEILSYLVGPKGRVVAHNNTPYLEFAKEELAKRYAPGRVANVERLVAENNALKLEPGTFDAVLMVDAYHDIYFEDEKAGWPRIDGPKLLAEIYKGLRPGGVLGVVDHVAAAGAPPETGGTLHRIDPDRLRREIAAAGFVFEAQSPVLRNAADDHTRPVFDAAIRGHTDQAVLRFRKPK